MLPVVRKQHRVVFSQPFTPFLGPATTAYEKLKFPLEVKDIIYFLMFLFSEIQSPFRDRVRLPSVAPPKLATEVRGTVQAEPPAVIGKGG